MVDLAHGCIGHCKLLFEKTTISFCSEHMSVPLMIIRRDFKTSLQRRLPTRTSCSSNPALTSTESVHTQALSFLLDTENSLHFKNENQSNKKVIL